MDLEENFDSFKKDFTDIKSILDYFRNIKKSELHLHLDGSLRIDTVKEIIENEKLNINFSKDMMKVNSKGMLEDYLKKFDIPIKIMQSKSVLKRVSTELLEDLYRENYEYIEVRFAPHFHTEKGLKLEEVIESVLEGINESSSKYNIKAKLILCIMRNLEVKKGFEILELAKKYNKFGVCGIDLAGDERNYPVELFKEVFKKSKDAGIKFTIHAGEADGAVSIKKAIEIGAARIGHGVRAFEDKNVVESLIMNNIPLEMCPISNFQTQVLKDFKKYPIFDYIKKGIFVSLNTDNRTVSDTNLEKEISFLYDLFLKIENFEKYKSIQEYNKKFLSYILKMINNSSKFRFV